LDSFDGESVEATLKALDLSLDDAVYMDEPPGKLRSLRFEGNLRNPDVILNLDYDISLFSIQRSWEDESVRNATVRKIEVK